MSNAWCNELASRIMLFSPPGIRILEVGAFDVNGSPQAFLRPFAGEYIGTDMRAGPGVDRVISADNLLDAFGPASFDAVVSTEMLEHCYNWPGAVFNMVSVLKPKGLLVVTARSFGFGLHDYPADHWRFERDDFGYIFGGVGNFLSLESDPSGWPGVGLLMRRTVETIRPDEYLLGRLANRPIYNMTLERAVTLEQIVEHNLKVASK